MINSEDISVVVQGPVDELYIHKTLNSIRKFLPNAEIVLSTWVGTNVQNLDYDVLVLNKDPGACVFTLSGRRQNQNRQIVSTKNGIKHSTRLYVLKIRSDMMLKGVKFLKYFGLPFAREPSFSLLEQRVLINSLYTRHSFYLNHHKNNITLSPFLFHPSDWMMFGLKKDLLNIWDIPLALEPQVSQYFLHHSDLPHYTDCLTRWHAEQYIWLSFLKKNGILFNFDNYFCYNDELRILSERSIVNNTFLLEYKSQFDIVCQKYTYRLGDSETMHPLDWFILYKKYCDPSYKISFPFQLKHLIQNSKYHRKLYKNFKKLSSNGLFSFKSFEAIFSIIRYIFIYIFYIIYSFFYLLGKVC